MDYRITLRRREGRVGTYVAGAVRPDRHEGDPPRPQEPEEDEDAHDEVVPPRAPEVGVPQPGLLVGRAEAVALEPAPGGGVHGGGGKMVAAAAAAAGGILDGDAGGWCCCCGLLLRGRW